MNTKTPVLFVGHGSPMNAIEDNEFTSNWASIAERIPKPEAILSISAHWYTNGTKIMDQSQPKTVYDFYGFPEELYRVSYKPKGSPEFSLITQKLIKGNVEIDNSWGIDHGTWSVLCRMYPEAEIPVYQLSIDRSADAASHYRLGQEISSLRDKGVLIFGSGNVVHNLSKISWGMDEGYPWAQEFDHYIKDKIAKKEYNDVINYSSAGKSSELAFYSPDHFYPLLYVLGASNADDRLSIFNDQCTMGSLSMTCYLFQ